MIFLQLFQLFLERLRLLLRFLLLLFDHRQCLLRLTVHILCDHLRLFVLRCFKFEQVVQALRFGPLRRESFFQFLAPDFTAFEFSLVLVLELLLIPECLLSPLARLLPFRLAFLLLLS